MISYNPDGSGTITVNNTVRAFPAGISGTDLIAMQAAFVAANDPPPDPPTVNVTVNAPDVTALQANVTDLQANVSALQASVAALTKPPITAPSP